MDPNGCSVKTQNIKSPSAQPRHPWRTSMSRWHMGHRGAVAVFAVAVALRSHWAQQGPHAVCDAKISWRPPASPAMAL